MCAGREDGRWRCGYSSPVTTRAPAGSGKARQRDDGPILPTERAFVVQFTADAAAVGGILGRVEHVVSGHSTQFATTLALLEFIEEVLRTIGEGADG